MNTATSRWRVALQSSAFAPAFCIAIGAALQAFACLVFYVVYFARPPLCDVFCIFETFAPSLATSLWALWLIAWHLPHWRDTPRAGRVSIIVQGCGIPAYIGAIAHRA